MTFHGRSNPGKNKCSIGYRHKQGKNFRLHKTAVEEAGQAADHDPDCAYPDLDEPPPTKQAADHDPDCAYPDLDEPPPTKKERSDNNWRSARGIVARDKKLEIVFLQRDALAKSNVSLSKIVSEQKSKVKKLENRNYVDAKASRTATIEKEELHKRAITLLCENHACDIEAAFAVADQETNKNLETDKLRLISEKEYSTNMRKERQRSCRKLKKELSSQKTVNEYSHKRWMHNLACNLAKQKKEHQIEGTKLQKKLDSKDEEINDERRKNQERSELPTVISHLRSFTNISIHCFLFLP